MLIYVLTFLVVVVTECLFKVLQIVYVCVCKRAEMEHKYCLTWMHTHKHTYNPFNGNKIFGCQQNCQVANANKFMQQTFKCSLSRSPYLYLSLSAYLFARTHRQLNTKDNANANAHTLTHTYVWLSLCWYASMAQCVCVCVCGWMNTHTYRHLLLMKYA